jgi:disulfide bond formation protein DsbB
MPPPLAALTPSEIADIQGIIVLSAFVALGALALASTHAAVRREAATALAGTGTWLAAGVALLATAGSLWYSESAGFPPCELCWYQRIAMYPLVVVLAMAAARGSATGRLTGLVIAGAGLAVSTWHNVIETVPDLGAGSCDPANPCTIRWVEGLGFWTIPRLAAASFVLVIVLVTLDHLAQHLGKEQP